MTWVKPQRQKGWREDDWAALPDTIQLRAVRIFIAVKGFRVRQYDLLTPCFFWQMRFVFGVFRHMKDF